MTTKERLLAAALLELASDEKVMTTKERLLAAALLELASDEFSNHGCNDMDKYMLAKIGFTNEEKIELARQYHEWNGDPEEFDGTVQEFNRMGDWTWMSFMAHKLKTV